MAALLVLGSAGLALGARGIVSKSLGLYMENTEISPTNTAGEITGLLVRVGARQIVMDYAEPGKLTGLHFSLVIHGVHHPFRLPVRTEGVYRILQAGHTAWNRHQYETKDRIKAERVAWRQLLRWVQAQLAMIDAGMVETREVFLPYVVDEESGKTLFEVFEVTRFKALPAASGEKR